MEQSQFNDFIDALSNGEEPKTNESQKQAEEPKKAAEPQPIPTFSNGEEEVYIATRELELIERFKQGIITYEELETELPLSKVQELLVANNNTKQWEEAKKLYQNLHIGTYLDNHHKLTRLADFLATQDDPIRIQDPLFKELNKKINGGITYGKTYVLGADTSMGKTAFSMQLVKSLAMQGVYCIYFALEMTTAELDAILKSNCSYVLAKRKGLSLKSIKGEYNETNKKYEITNGFTLTRSDAFSSLFNKQLKELEPNSKQADFLKEVDEECAEIRKYIYFMDTDQIRKAIGTDARVSGEVLYTIVKVFIERYKTIPFIVVDYLQMLDTEKETDSRYTSTTDNANVLKRIAAELNAPTWILTSLSRTGARQPIQQEYFKESGQIEYNADLTIGLQLRYYEEVYKEILSNNVNTTQAKIQTQSYYANTQKEAQRELEIYVIKNRQGERYTHIEIDYIPAYNYMELKPYALDTSTAQSKTQTIKRLITKYAENAKDDTSKATQKLKEDRDEKEQEEIFKKSMLKLIEAIFNMKPHKEDLKQKRQELIEDFFEGSQTLEADSKQEQCLLNYVKAHYKVYIDNGKNKMKTLEKRYEEMAKDFILNYEVITRNYKTEESAAEPEVEPEEAE